MKKNKIFSIYILFLLLSFSIIKAQTFISFNDYIELVKQEHPFAKKALNVANIGQLQKNSASGYFDPQLNSGIENKFFNGKNYYTLANAELKQSIYSGQSLKIGYEYGQGAQINPGDLTPASGLPYVGLEVSLLQGMMIDKKRYEVLKAEQYKKLLETESKITLNELLVNASESYINWLKDYALAETNKKYIEIALKRFEAIKTLSAIGEKPSIDTVEAGILNQTRFLEYYNALISLNKSSYGLYSFLWKNDTNVVIPDAKPKEVLSILIENCLKSLLNHDHFSIEQNPGIIYYSYKKNLLNVERRYKKELIKPKLDLKYNLLGNSSNTSNYLNNYKWGAGFSMPLFLRTSINDLKTTQLHLKNNEYDLNQKSTELKNKILAAKNNLNLIMEQLETAKTTLQYCRILLDAEKIKFDHQESSQFLLNTRESKLLESEIKYIEVQSKFLLSYFYLVYLSGEMKYNLSL